MVYFAYGSACVSVLQAVWEQFPPHLSLPFMQQALLPPSRAFPFPQQHKILVEGVLAATCCTLEKEIQPLAQAFVGLHLLPGLPRYSQMQEILFVFCVFLTSNGHYWVLHLGGVKSKSPNREGFPHVAE